MKQNQNYVEYLQKLLSEREINYLSEEEFQSKKLKSSKTQQQKEISKNEQILLTTNIKEPLNSSLIQRYSRQMLLKQVSFEGQIKITSAKVAVIGSGGIGCPLALYLAAAGIGTLGLFDSDVVDVTNLHRQIGHNTERVGMQKTESLKKTLSSINPHITIKTYPYITAKNCSLLDQYDLVIDGSDNPKCRYIVNDYCMSRGKKLLSGACIGWQAQITCYGGDNLCYRCLWGDDQKTRGGCSTLGVVGMIPGFVGVILALQALKMILFGNSSLQGRLLTYDGLSGDFKKMMLRKRKVECIGCGQFRLKIQNYDYQKYDTCSSMLPLEKQIKQLSWQEYLKSQHKKLLDVRPQNIYQIFNFKHSRNIPLQKLKNMTKDEIVEYLNLKEDQIISIMCVRGISSKIAVDYLNGIGLNSQSIKGGVKAYKKEIDSNIPEF